MTHYLNTIGALFGAVLGAFFGGLGGLLIALICFMACDYLTGVISAIKRHKVNSNVGYWGIVKKCLILMLVGICNLLDKNIIGSGSICRTACIMFYLSNDGISILENLTEIGLPVPAKVRKVLEQLKEGENDEG